MTEQPNDDSGRNRRLDEILAEYFRALEAGQTPDKEAFLARHADFAAELAEFLADKDRFERFAVQLPVAAAAEQPTLDTAEASPAPKVSQAGSVSGSKLQLGNQRKRSF
jgi:hypothetical protein